MTPFHLHLVSDATGETLNAIARAVSVQFEDFDAIQHLHAMVRTRPQMELALDAIERTPGFVIFTIVDKALRDQLEAGCQARGLPFIAVMDPVLNALGLYLGAESAGRPGQQHQLDAEYFSRIEAMAYTMAHDDGIKTDDLHLADVVLVGVSRTSKTPTCVYLAGRGLKTANIPIVPGIPLPEELDGLTKTMIVGLTLSPDRLIRIRQSRLQALAESAETDYVDPEIVANEVAHARRLFSRQKWPVIDVTRRSIEETAAAILALRDEAR